MAAKRSRRSWCSSALALALAVVAPAAAQDQPEDVAAEERMVPRLDFGLEAKGHVRDSDAHRFPVNFPFEPGQLPPGETRGSLRTVNEGSHFEVSTLTLFIDAVWSEALVAHAKIDAVDLYDRNPTSTDKELDVDEVWVRFGREAEPAMPPERSGAYVKIGKMPKLERQDDRHLESYGLAATAFNRFEDAGVEVGADLGRFLYLKGSATQGNPVFMRDPNALAGDNGTPVFMRPFPDPELGSGVVILYDAEIEDLDVDGDLELGAGVGLRFGDAAGLRGVDLLAWGYRRRLADTVELEGTFYGGDLDLLDGPSFRPTPLPVTSDDKEEVGANLWVYLGGFSFFGQYVDQDLGGLGRTAWEAEAAFRLELPLVWAVGGRQLFPWVAPAVRWSKLDPEFRSHPQSPSPSFAWEWEKLDAGVRLAVVEGVDLTVEHAANDFVLGSGARRDNDELLATLRVGL